MKFLFNKYLFFAFKDDDIIQASIFYSPVQFDLMICICLVNTYDKLKLHEIHLRTIARAAPICCAYGFHLALLDFPFWKSEEEIVNEVVEYTTIGEDGKFARKLLEERKIHLIEKIPAHFGEVIATTSKPEKRALGEDELRKLLKEGSVTFLIGLGRRGLPREMIKKSKYQLDVTWKGISLETCSAIGVISATAYWLSRPSVEGDRISDRSNG